MCNWQKNLTIAALGCLICVSDQAPAQAGVIPWAYNAVFGPPGSMAAMRQARRSGYYAGYAPYGYAATPMYRAPMAAPCGPCGQAQMSYYAPMVASCSTCNSGCATGNCASGNCSANYGGFEDPAESADDAGLEKADEAAGGTTWDESDMPPDLPPVKDDEFVPSGTTDEGYDADKKGDAELWPAPIKEEARKIPMGTGDDILIEKREPAPIPANDDTDASSSSLPILKPIDADSKVTWRVAPTASRFVRVARYSLPSVARVQHTPVEFRVLVPALDHQIASK